jgi:hypothetical protein
MVMRLRLAAAITLALALTSGARAELRLECPALLAVMQDLTGYAVTAPPTALTDGACVLDRARLTAAGRPDLTVDNLRIGGNSPADATMSVGAREVAPTRLDLDLAGVRLAPKPGADEVPGWLQSALRLQSADLTVSLQRNESEDVLNLRSGRLALSGGTELTFEATVRGAEISRFSILTGLLTDLQVNWKSDGRLVRPAMETAGKTLEDGASGSAAIDAARAALRDVADALPPSRFVGGSLEELEQLIQDLPQGRGRMAFGLTSSQGIGAVSLGLLAMADDPTGPDALADLLADSLVTVDWQPGLAP